MSSAKRGDRTLIGRSGPNFSFILNPKSDQDQLDTKDSCEFPNLIKPEFLILISNYYYYYY